MANALGPQDLQVEKTNPCLLALGIFQRYELYLNEHVDETLAIEKALYQKVSDYAELSAYCRKHLQDAPSYIDYSEDPEIKKLVQLFNEDTKHPELNADKLCRLTKDDALSMIDRLEILIKKNQNEAQAQSLSIQPTLLKSIETTQCFRKMIEYFRDFISLIERNMKV